MPVTPVPPLKSLPDCGGVAATPASNDVLTWDSVNSRWKNAAPSGGGATNTPATNVLLYTFFR